MDGISWKFIGSSIKNQLPASLSLEMTRVIVSCFEYSTWDPEKYRWIFQRAWSHCPVMPMEVPSGTRVKQNMANVRCNSTNFTISMFVNWVWVQGDWMYCRWVWLVGECNGNIKFLIQFIHVSPFSGASPSPEASRNVPVLERSLSEAWVGWLDEAVFFPAGLAGCWVLLFMFCFLVVVFWIKL